MQITPAVRKILSYYESDNPGTKSNLARMLMHGKLQGTGKLLILAVDQGFEHGPTRSFAMNSQAYDPHYHYKLAVDSGLSAYAAPLGALEAGADTFAGAVPTILKMNSSNTLMKLSSPDQAVTASIQDALRLGCSAIGFTIYPGSQASLNMFEEIRELASEAKNHGLAVIIWSYARGDLSSEGELALDVLSYGAHMACLLGAHIVKVKIPTVSIEDEASKKALIKAKIPYETLEDRLRYVVNSCFNGRRLVIFSGGATKDETNLLEEAQAILTAGGSGSIIGRNIFQRSHQESLELIEELVKIYQKR
jgi:class I fructose-bisphosphate aldolase